MESIRGAWSGHYASSDQRRAYDGAETSFYGAYNTLASLSLATPTQACGSGSGMERRLRGIVGGSLEQLSESLHYLPASRTNALPSTEAHALLSSVGFNDRPPPDISALLRQPDYGDSGANRTVAADAGPAPRGQEGQVEPEAEDMGEPASYEDMTGKVGGLSQARRCQQSFWPRTRGAGTLARDFRQATQGKPSPLSAANN
jgi:hypothetical protein